MERQSSRKEWEAWEDLLITELVRQHGNKAWAIVAGALPQRTGKQCRERWHNHLDPMINKGDWTQEEDLQLIEAHRAMSNRWADIAKAFEGRTDNQIKNRWNSALRRELRKLNRVVSKQPGLVKAMVAATAAVSAAAGSSDVKEPPPELEPGTSSPSADGDDGPCLRRRQHGSVVIGATRDLVARTSGSLELDRTQPPPPGVTETDQRNAEQLLGHVCKLRAAWTAAPPGAGGELSDEAMDTVSQHVDWLHGFCRQLVEQSLMLQRETSGEDGSKRKRKRRTIKPRPPSPPAPPPIAHAVLFGPAAQPIPQPFAQHTQLLPAGPFQEAAPMACIVPGARPPPLILLKTEPAPEAGQPAARFESSCGGFDVNELLSLVHGEGTMPSPPPNPPPSMRPQPHGPLSIPPQPHGPFSMPPQANAPSQLISPLGASNPQYLPSCQPDVSMSPMSPQPRIAAAFVSSQPGSPLGALDSPYSSSNIYSPRSERVLSGLRVLATSDEPPNAPSVPPHGTASLYPPAPPTPAPRRCAPMWPVATPYAEEGPAPWTDDEEEEAFDDSPLPQRKAAILFHQAAAESLPHPEAAGFFPPREAAATGGVASRRPLGVYNLNMALCSTPQPPAFATLSSGGSSVTDTAGGLTTARLAALASPSLMSPSPSFCDHMEARSTPFSPPSRHSPGCTVQCR